VTTQVTGFVVSRGTPTVRCVVDDRDPTRIECDDGPVDEQKR